jgi:hypothetical protein
MSAWGCPARRRLSTTWPRCSHCIRETIAGIQLAVNLAVFMGGYMMYPPVFAIFLVVSESGFGRANLHYLDGAVGLLVDYLVIVRSHERRLKDLPPRGLRRLECWRV